MPETCKRIPNIKCFVCSKAVYRRPSQIRKSKGILFCSLECNGVNNQKYTKCVICAKSILISKNEKTCSRSCSNKLRKGIKYKVGRPRDNVYTIQSIKIRLLDERGKRCERCGYDSVNILQVHHKNRNNKDNRFDNLEIICPNCHCEEHYGEKI
jgi:predicted nucleic acid-binding Zn ribbon protein